MKKLSFLLIFAIASAPGLEARKLTDKAIKIATGITAGIASVLFIAGGV